MKRPTSMRRSVRLLAIAALVVTAGCRTPQSQEQPAPGTRTVRAAPVVPERTARTAPSPGSRYVTSMGLPDVGSSGASSAATERLEAFLRPIESIPARPEKR